MSNIIKENSANEKQKDFNFVKESDKDLTPAQRYYRKHKQELQKYGREYYKKHKENRKEYYKTKNKEYYKSLTDEEKKKKSSKVKEWLQNHDGYMNNYNKNYSKDRYKKLEVVIKLAKEILNKDYTEEQLKTMTEQDLKNLKKTIHNTRCKKFYHDNIERYKEKLTCDICNKQYLRCNKSVHVKTNFHRIHQDIKDAIKKI